MKGSTVAAPPHYFDQGILGSVCVASSAAARHPGASRRGARDDPRRRSSVRGDAPPADRYGRAAGSSWVALTDLDEYPGPDVLKALAAAEGAAAVHFFFEPHPASPRACARGVCPLHARDVAASCGGALPPGQPAWKPFVNPFFVKDATVHAAVPSPGRDALWALGPCLHHRAPPPRTYEPLGLAKFWNHDPLAAARAAAFRGRGVDREAPAASDGAAAPWALHAAAARAVTNHSAGRPRISPKFR